MGPRRLLIHLSLPDSPIFKADLHILLHFCCGLHNNLGELLHEDSPFGALPELLLLLDVLAQEVMDLLVVDLDEAAPHHVVLYALGPRDGHDLAEGTGDDAALCLGAWQAHHCECFAAACS